MSWLDSSSRGAATGQLWRFGLVGVINTAIDFGLLNLLVAGFAGTSGGGLLACNSVAWGVANLNSYFCNRAWTFSRDNPASLHEYTNFLAISLIGLMVNSLTLWLLTGGAAVSFVQLNFGKAGATLLSMIWNFCGYRLLLARRVAV